MAGAEGPERDGVAEKQDIERAGERDDELVDRLEKAGKTAVKVAASTVVATTLVSALAEPPHAEMMSLPEPTPIVQIYQAVDDEPVPDEDDETEDKTSRWRRLLRVLKLLLVALTLVGAVVFGVLKGCAGIVGVTLLPSSDERQEQEQTSGHTTPTEDERGVAVAG